MSALNRVDPNNRQNSSTTIDKEKSKVEKVVEGIELNHEMILSNLQIGERKLCYSEEISVDKLTDEMKNSLINSLREIFVKVLENEDLKKVKGSYDLYFSLSEKEGLVVRIGKKGKDIKIAPYKDFLIGNRVLFNEKLSPYQKLLQAAKETESYAKCANLGKRVTDNTLKPNDLETRVNEQFQKGNIQLLAQRKELEEGSFLQKYKEYLLLGTNSSSAAYNLLKNTGLALNNPFFVLASSIPCMIKGLSYLLYNIASMREAEYLSQKKVEKFTGFEKFLMVFSSIFALTAFTIGLLLLVSLGLTLEAVKKVYTVVNGIVFGYVLCSLFSLFQIALESIRLFRTVKLRKELNQFLENTYLSKQERCLGYLKKVKETISLSEEEVNQIKSEINGRREKIKNDLKKAKYISVSDDSEELKREIANKIDVEKEINFEIQKKLRQKIESFQKCASKGVTEEVLRDIDRLILKLSVEKVENDDLNKAIELVGKIDKATYQNMVTHIVYILIFIACLAGTFINGPTACAFFWLTIALIFVFWDYSGSNNALTAIVYENGFFGKGSRKDKIKLLLDNSKETQIEKLKRKKAFSRVDVNHRNRHIKDGRKITNRCPGYKNRVDRKIAIHSPKKKVKPRKKTIH